MTENKYELFNNMFEPCFVLSKDESILYFNNSFSIFTTASPRAIKKAEKVSEILNSEKFKFGELVSSTLEKQAIVLTEEHEITLGKADADTRIAVFKLTPIAEDEVLVMINDLSLETRLHDKYKSQLEELKETHGQIMQANKLSTLGELTASISHEISNPLTVANGSAELVEMCLETEDLNLDRDLIESSLDDIKEAHHRINSIIINMKSYLHKGEKEQEYCDIGEILEKSAALVRPGYKDAKVALNIENRSGSAMILADQQKIEQVIINLLKNALYAISDSRTENGIVSVYSEKDKKTSTVRIIVEDNGPGIPEEIQDSVFTTFFTTKKAGEGTGMGLSISEKIIRTHLGSIELDKSFSAGARFVINFPSIEINAMTNSEVLKNNMTTSSVIQRKILVVDNETKILNLFKTFLSDGNMKFFGAENAESALAGLKKYDVDMIITDIHLEDMNGSELVEQIRELNITVPVLYLSSKDYIDIYNRDKESLGIDGMIIKPFTKDEVVNSISSFFEGEK